MAKLHYAKIIPNSALVDMKFSHVRLFEAGRKDGLKTKASKAVCQEFSEYESRACSHARELLAQRTEIAEKTRLGARAFI